MRLVLATLLLIGCEDTNSVRIRLHWSALACVGADGEPLLARAEPPEEGERPRASIVVDFLRMHGASGCRAGEIREACREGDCDRVSESRWCTEGELPARREDSREWAAACASAISDGLAGSVVTEDAPDGYVLVRLVASAQTCEEIERGPLDVERLVGCAYSCPVVLDETEGAILLALDSLTDSCELAVGACALLGDPPPE